MTAISFSDKNFFQKHRIKYELSESGKIFDRNFHISIQNLLILKEDRFFRMKTDIKNLVGNF